MICIVSIPGGVLAKNIIQNTRENFNKEPDGLKKQLEQILEKDLPSTQRIKLPEPVEERAGELENVFNQGLADKDQQDINFVNLEELLQKAEEDLAENNLQGDQKSQEVFNALGNNSVNLEDYSKNLEEDLAGNNPQGDQKSQEVLNASGNNSVNLEELLKSFTPYISQNDDLNLTEEEKNLLTTIKKSDFKPPQDQIIELQGLLESLRSRREHNAKQGFDLDFL